MNEQKENTKLYSRLSRPAFYVAILGATKLVIDAFGLQLFSDDQVNSIANGLAALATVVGVAMGYE